MQAEKDIKQLAKEAKQRLKSGFWSKYREDVQRSADVAKNDGIAKSVVVDYYQTQNRSTAKKSISEKETFYLKVKNILDTQGEVSNILSLLIDYSVYDSLSYDGKQRYMLDLSNKYLQCLERYRMEKKFNK